MVQCSFCISVYAPGYDYHANEHITLAGAKTISGSVTGGTKDTQEMLDFCAANKIYPQVEVIDIQYINEALQRLVDKDVKYRFVIDIVNS